jgi:hypothetical protein
MRETVRRGIGDPQVLREPLHWKSDEHDRFVRNEHMLDRNA